jgi:hypothetical protein
LGSTNILTLSSTPALAPMIFSSTYLCHLLTWLSYSSLAIANNGNMAPKHHRPFTVHSVAFAGSSSFPWPLNTRKPCGIVSLFFPQSMWNEFQILPSVFNRFRILNSSLICATAIPLLSSQRGISTLTWTKLKQVFY